MDNREAVRRRILILTSGSAEANQAISILEQDGLDVTGCSQIDELLAKIDDGAAVAVIGDENLNERSVDRLSAWVRKQSAWSDFPFIVLTGEGTASSAMKQPLKLIERLGNLALVERPLRAISLLTVVKAALRTRDRQYQAQYYIEEVRRAESDRAQAYAREEGALAQIELLNHVGEILSAELNVNLLLQAVTDSGTALSGADLGMFFWEGDPNQPGVFGLCCSSGVSMDVATATLGDSAMIQGSDMDRRVMRLPDAGTGEAHHHPVLHAIVQKLGIRSYLAFPVSSRRGALAGVLLLAHLGESSFSSRDERVSASLASQAAIAIDNAQLFALAQTERRRLEATRQILQRSNEELRQFAYVASHDLQEPLRTVASFTQLLVDRYREQAGPDAAAWVSYIVEGVQRMSALIHDLLEYSYTGIAKELPEYPNPVEPALDEVLFALSASIRESGAVITNDPLPAAWMENRSIAQLFQNLIGNAIKYRSERPLRVHISAELKDDDWVFSVRDNGIGIAQEYHERIFGIFKRLHGKEIPGTGIGLAICQRIVEWHGGRIWVESRPGDGSTFCFSLPKDPQRVQREMAEFAASGAKLGEPHFDTASAGDGGMTQFGGPK